MMKSLSQSLSALFSETRTAPALGEQEMRLAAAALLVHAAAIDGAISETETGALAARIKDRFGLTDDETHELLIAAERRENEAIDLYGFTAKIKQTMTAEERQGLIYMMWEVAFADGKLDAMEDNLLWRAAELLGVSAQDRMAMKKRAAGDI